MPRTVTGFWFIDTLIGDIPWDWIIEFYGSSEKVLNTLFHHVLVHNSRFTRVYTILFRDFGGLNPYFITRLSRIFSGNIDNVLVSRSFRYMDLVELLEDLLGRGTGDKEVLIIYNPFNNVKGEPSDYIEAGRVIGLLHKLKNRGWRIILFNKISSNGNSSPEGGNYHHHVVNVIIRVEAKSSEWCYAEIVKHPFRRNGLRKSFPYKKLFPTSGGELWVEQRLLTEWL